jgi:hypothetical protein
MNGRVPKLSNRHGQTMRRGETEVKKEGTVNAVVRGNGEAIDREEKELRVKQEDDVKKRMGEK